MADFVERRRQQLFCGDAPYGIVGGNNYYLAYVSEPVQDAVLALAKQFGMNSLRIWAFLDCAAQPGAQEVCFQYWDSVQQKPVGNDGPYGLERLDRAVAKAGGAGMKVILTLVNHWKDFGGMPQYVSWFGLGDKNLFYTDARCLIAYQNWARQIVMRCNSVTGVLYRDDPAILAWELANEPRCEAQGGVDMLLTWVETMSRFVRQIDPNHLIAVGDEGYFKRARAGGNVLYNGAYGVSCEELLGIGDVDLGTVHLYPQSMAPDTSAVDFGNRWIREHIEAGQRADKPMLIEEYGFMGSDAARDPVFDSWLQGVEAQRGVGDMLWMLGLPKGPDQPFDPDQYVVSDAAAMPGIRNHVDRMLNSRAGRASAPYPIPG